MIIAKFTIFCRNESDLEIALENTAKHNCCKANYPFQMQDSPMNIRKWVGLCSTLGRGYPYF